MMEKSQEKKLLTYANGGGGINVYSINIALNGGIV